jgi:hypothetical protein
MKKKKIETKNTKKTGKNIARKKIKDLIKERIEITNLFKNDDRTSITNLNSFLGIL